MRHGVAGQRHAAQDENDAEGRSGDGEGERADQRAAHEFLNSTKGEMKRLYKRGSS